jgi:hypothetical protein
MVEFIECFEIGLGLMILDRVFLTPIIEDINFFVGYPVDDLLMFRHG